MNRCNMVNAKVLHDDVTYWAMVTVRIVDIPYNAIYNDHEASSVSEYVHFLSFIKIYLSKPDCDVKIVFHHNGGMPLK